MHPYFIFSAQQRPHHAAIAVADLLQLVDLNVFVDRVGQVFEAGAEAKGFDARFARTSRSGCHSCRNYTP